MLTQSPTSPTDTVAGSLRQVLAETPTLELLATAFVYGAIALTLLWMFDTIRYGIPSNRTTVWVRNAFLRNDPRTREQRREDDAFVALTKAYHQD